MIAAGGYPGSYPKGMVIEGLDQVDNSHSKVFHAGTRLNNGDVVTSGGRVLCAVALGKGVTEAQRRAYQLAAEVTFEGAFCRSDIGYRAVAREKAKLTHS